MALPSLKWKIVIKRKKSTTFACRPKAAGFSNMSNNPFNPAEQENSLSNKLVAGLERISEVFKILLWEKAKIVGLSPIQIQLLIFVAYHPRRLCNVSHLAKEFNVTKPTISDAVKVLNNKGLIEKDFSEADQRRYSIFLTALGEELVKETNQFAAPLQQQVAALSNQEQEALFGTVSKLIYQFNQVGILEVQRTCYSCKFFEEKNHGAYCRLLEKALQSKDLRIDCPEFEASV